MKLNIKALALAGGIFWGIGMLLMTLWIFYFGTGTNEMLSSFSDFYFGYNISLSGAFIGLGWGFVDGLVSCAIFAWLYNRFIK